MLNLCVAVVRRDRPVEMTINNRVLCKDSDPVTKARAGAADACAESAEEAEASPLQPGRAHQLTLTRFP